MTELNDVITACDNFFDAISEKECVIALYDAASKKLGYIADTNAKNIFDAINTLSMTKDKNEALRVKWTKDAVDNRYYLDVKGELIEGCDLFHELEFGAYLLELAD